MIKGSGYDVVKIEDDSVETLYHVGKATGPATIAYAINYLIKDQLDYNYLNFNPDLKGEAYSEIDYRLNLPTNTSTAQAANTTT